MSKTIDERIVSMRFDNKDFEKNANESLSTLDKLKKALDFKGSTKGLSDVNNSIKGISVDALSKAIDTINHRFSDMGVIATTALQNITNSVINTGRQMLESLTIDPVKEGFSEYELKLGSIQTILNSARDAQGNAVDLDTVKSKLEELNTYADKTIYSFSDMTSSIGKFTNAGVDLDKSVKAIQGISNEAALSGANAEQASHAMYNFAQALSSGSVKLIDWKSIENANMATVEFKQQLIDTAVAAGTLEDNLDGTYTVLTENGSGATMDGVISATQMFNDSLQYQWMTSDVLIDTLGRYADETTEIGNRAFDAAQDVKSFTQLMDTLKESVGSGWAETWEIVFGDYNEAKDLWTNVYEVVGGFIDRQSKARNEMLKSWKEMNGRNAIMDGFRELYSAITTITTTVRSAFDEFFHFGDAAELITNLSFKFRGLMHIFNEFINDEDHIETMSNLFRGLFGTLKIIYNVLHTTYVFVQPFIGLILAGAAKIIGLLAKLGKIIADNQSIISETLDKVIVLILSNLLVVIEALISSVGKLFDKVSEFVEKNDILGKLTSVLTQIEAALHSLVGFIETTVLPQMEGALYKLFDTIENAVKFVGPKLLMVFEGIVLVIGGGILAIANAILGFGGIDTSSVDEFVGDMEKKTSPLTVIFDKISFMAGKVVELIKFVYPYVTRFLSPLVGVVGDIVKRMIQYVTTMNASQLMDWIQTGTFVGFLLQFKKVADSLTGAKKMFSAITDVFEGLGKTLKTYQKDLKADILEKIAIAVGILAGSILVLSFVPADNLIRSVEAIGTVLGLLAASTAAIIKVMGDPGLLQAIGQTGIIKAMGSFFIELASAVAILSACMIALSKVGKDEMTTAFIAISGLEALLAAIAGLITIMPKSENSIIAVGVGMLLIAKSIRKLVDAVLALLPAIEEIDKMSPESLKKGLAVLGGMLVGLTVMAVAIGQSKIGITSAVGLLAMVYMLKEVTDVMVFLGTTDADVKRGLLVLGLMITALSGLSLAAGEMGAGTGVAFIGMAVALEVIVDVMKKFAEMSIGDIAKGLITLAGALFVLSAAVVMMSGASVGAFALILMATAIEILVPALKAFSEMSVGGIVKSLLMFAGVMAVLAGVSIVMSTIAPGMMLFGAALGVIGLGLVVLSAGLMAFAAALAAIAVIDVAAVMAIIPMFGLMILEFCKMIASVADTVADAIATLIAAVITGLANHMDEMVAGLMSIILSILKGIRDNIEQITEDIVVILFNFIIGLIEGLIKSIAGIIQKLWELVIACIEGIAAALSNKENAERLRGAIINLATSIVEFFKNFFGINSPSTVFQELGWNLIEGLILGIGELIDKVVGIIINLGEKMLSAISDKFNDFKDKGAGVINKIGEGIDSVKDTVKKTFHGVIDSLKNFDIKGFVNSGKNILLGLKRGLEDNETFKSLINTTKSVFGAVRDRIAAIFDEHSPSRVTFGFGRYVVEGFANGMNAYANLATDAADSFGTSTLDRIKSAISTAYDLIENGVDSDLAIRPVLDLSNVSSGMNELNSMMDNANSLDLAANANFGMNGILSDNQNGIVVNNLDIVKALGSLKNGLNVDNNDIIAAILDLKNNIAEMNNALHGLNVVLDTGTLVGELTEPMDRSFGRMMAMNERGV